MPKIIATDLRIWTHNHCDWAHKRGCASPPPCYDALLAINGIPEIQEEVHSTFSRNLSKIKTQMLNNPPFDEEVELVQNFLNRLRA